MVKLQHGDVLKLKHSKIAIDREFGSDIAFFKLQNCEISFFQNTRSDIAFCSFKTVKLYNFLKPKREREREVILKNSIFLLRSNN